MKHLSQLTDENLIKLYIVGDNNAFETIVNRHKDKIYTSIYLLIGDKYLAEDIFQDVFIRVIDNIKRGKYNESGNFKNWVMTIAHNLSIDHHRNIKRKPAIITSADKDIFEVLAFAEENIEERIINEETHIKVRKLLDKLSQEQREVIVLRNYANLSFKEIAKLTDTCVNTSLGRMRYGLLNLRKLYNETPMA